MLNGDAALPGKRTGIRGIPERLMRVAEVATPLEFVLVRLTRYRTAGAPPRAEA